MIFKHSVSSFVKDLRRFLDITKNRQAHFDAAPETTPVYEYGANRTAAALHPDSQNMKVTAVGCGQNGIVLELHGKTAAVFRPGQSVNILACDAVYPCFIVSSPDEVKDGNYTVTTSDCKAVEYISLLNSGSEVKLGAPVGNFYYQGVRDGKLLSIICDSAGSAVAVAIIADIRKNHPDVVVNICDKPGQGSNYVIGTTAFCNAHPDFINNKKVRKLVTDMPRRACERKEYSCRIILPDGEKAISVFSDESLEQAFVKNGVRVTAAFCRDGECGFCRCRLVSGRIETVDVSPCSGKRTADDNFGYIHPCRSFPESDITVKF